MSFVRIPSISLALICSFTIGCSHLTRKDQSAENLQSENSTQTVGLAESETYKPLPQYGAVKLDVNKKVLQWINYFQTRGRRHMERYLGRSTKYLPLMKEVLRKHGMPEEISSLVFVESGFNAKAHSHAAAVGYWQFIGATGRRYGLHIDNYEDDRMDPWHSTEAAARYLAALYNMFDDWYLALAAYNTGEGRVKRAIRMHRTDDFWELAQKRRPFARETKNYVPKFIAVSLIAKNPERYGFTDIEYEAPLAFEKVLVNQSISMDKLAQEMGLKYEDIKSLNPRYRSDFIPVGTLRNVYVRVPVGYGTLAEEKLVLAQTNAPLRKLNPTYQIYRVRRGDSLSRIAYKFRTRISTLRRLNNLKRRSFLRVGQRLKVPNRYGASSSAGASQVASQKKVTSSTKKATHRRYSSKESQAKHTVRRGENLSVIARTYGVSVSDLRQWNRLKRRAIIRPGRKLIVSAKGRVHIVRRGENLTTIARKYQVNISQIAQANSITDRSEIFVGTSLIIPE
ncbi:MAG: LysM peptidoglycan-binding domain-containing protein [Bdellovibrionales bacterium]|nr:LysM peptidoglycan-binding domain-containing protein [Bdellovibrionales bacterium]